MSLIDIAASTKALGSRFTFSGILPFALLTVFGAALGVVAAAGSNTDPLLAISDAAGRYGPAGIAVLVVVALVVAVVTQPFQVGVVRLLEGYWGASKSAVAIRAVLTERQRRLHRRTWIARQEADDSDDDYRAAWHSERLLRYPSEQDLMPTLLGNTLRAAERSAGERYGLDTVKTWTRLYHVLPQSVRSDVAELHGQVDAGARLAIALGLAAVAAAPILVPHGWWNLVALSLAGLSWLSYRGAVTSAADLSDVLATAFDLHRFDLIKAMHLPLPATPDVEVEWNAHLSEFLQTGGEASDSIARYEHDL